MTIEEAERLLDERVYDTLSDGEETTVGRLAAILGRFEETIRRSILRLMQAEAVEVIDSRLDAWVVGIPASMIERSTAVRRVDREREAKVAKADGLVLARTILADPGTASKREADMARAFLASHGEES